MKTAHGRKVEQPEGVEAGELPNDIPAGIKEDLGPPEDNMPDDLPDDIPAGIKEDLGPPEDEPLEPPENSAPQGGMGPPQGPAKRKFITGDIGSDFDNNNNNN